MKSYLYLILGFFFVFGVHLAFGFFHITQTESSITPIHNTTQIEILREEPLHEEIIKEIQYPEHWTCFDYALNYSEQHPEWGIVVISHNPTFQGYNFGDNHVVNFQILPDKILLIHDEMNQNEYTGSGWQSDDGPFEYYHFFIDGEQPKRRWRILRSNAEEVYSAI